MSNVIIGGGYAGLFCAYQLSIDGINSSLYEKNEELGGLSRTFEKNGVKFDIGPHIYFNKDKEVTALWKQLLGENLVTRDRSNKIFYNGKYIHSPLKPFDAVSKLGLFTTTKIFLSFFYSKLFNKGYPTNSKEWVIQNFGEQLYQRFFKVYNEKIWGLPCEEITANWAGQRIKTSLFTMIKKSIVRDNNFIIKTFDYPIGGSQTLINAVESQLSTIGNCKLQKSATLVKVEVEDNTIVKLIFDVNGNTEVIHQPSNVISTISLKDFINTLNINVPADVKKSLSNLVFRDLILVNLVCPNEEIMNFSEHWVDIHDPSVKALRVTNFGNYDCEMSAKNYSPITLEYNCFATDEITSMTDEEIYSLAISDLKKLKFIVNQNPKFDFSVVRLKQAYPVYYKGFESDLKIINDYLGKIKNLQLIGRNAMYKWNNMHHSVKTGVLAAKNIQGENHNLSNVKGMVSIGKEYSADE